MLGNGKIDYATLRSLIDWHVREGSNALVVVGTTGESPTLTNAEHRMVLRVAVEHASGRIPIIAGCGSNDTRQAIKTAQFASSIGADAQLQVVPYYNKPTQEGLFEHFTAIAKATPQLPIILYNVPGRTVADLQHDTVVRLAQVPSIVGIKEATGSIERALWLIRDVPPSFAVYSGDDLTAVSLMLCGGSGNISVTANVVPRKMQALCEAAMAGDITKAMKLHFELMHLHRYLFIESNPIPVKWALALMGKCGHKVRSPLIGLSELHRLKLGQILSELGLV
jgi:4-hydroxy-tetrahydrodipicolinate synthase